MIELVMLKGLNGTLLPATEEDAAQLATLKTGAAVRVALTAFHNIGFHKKLMALFRIGFEVFEEIPGEPKLHKGMPIAKSFEGFRKDLTILAGHYTTYHRVNGDVRFEAKSLSYRKMGDDLKAKVYQDVLGQVWGRVLSHGGYRTPEHVDEIVTRLVGME